MSPTKAASNGPDVAADWRKTSKSALPTPTKPEVDAAAVGVPQDQGKGASTGMGAAEEQLAQGRGIAGDSESRFSDVRPAGNSGTSGAGGEAEAAAAAAAAAATPTPAPPIRTEVGDRARAKLAQPSPHQKMSRKNHEPHQSRISKLGKGKLAQTTTMDPAYWKEEAGRLGARM